MLDTTTIAGIGGFLIGVTAALCIMFVVRMMERKLADIITEEDWNGWAYR